jgi:hypothetical protein
MGDITPVTETPKKSAPEQNPWMAELEQQRKRLKLVEGEKERTTNPQKYSDGKLGEAKEKVFVATETFDKLLKIVKDVNDGKIKPTDSISLPDGRRITYSAYARELQDKIKTEMPAAIEASKSILEDPRDRKKDDNRTTAKEDQKAFTDGPNSKEARRKSLCQQLGFDPNDVDTDKLQAAIKSSDGNKDKQGKLKELLSLELEAAQIDFKSRAPAALRIIWADMISSGLLEGDPLTKQDAIKDTGLPKLPSTTTATEYRMLREAAARGETSVEGDQCKKIFGTVTAQYLDEQLSRCRTLMEHVKEAADDKNKDKREAMLKANMEEAKTIDLVFLRSQLDKLEKDEKQDPGAMVILRNAINSTLTPKWEYASYLAKNGQRANAMPLLLEIESDWVFLKQDKEKGRLSVSKDSDGALLAVDKGFAKLKAEVMLGDGVGASNPESHLAKYQKFSDAKDFASALSEVQEARKSLGKSYEALKTNEPEVEKRKAELEKEMKALDGRTDLTDRELELERQRIKLQVARMDAFLDGVKETDKLFAQINYLEGACELALGHKDTARGWLNDAIRKDKSLQTDEKYHMSELLAACEPESNWEVIKKGLIITLAVAAGAAAAALTIWSGPGALIAGGGVTAAIITGGLALTAGTLAGSVVYTGGTALSGEKVTARTWVEGGIYGLTGATMVVSAGVGSAIAPEATAVSTFSTSVARVGALRLLPAVSTAVVSNAGHKSSDAYFDNKDFDWGGFAKDTAIDTGAYMLFKPVSPGGSAKEATKEAILQTTRKEATRAATRVALTELIRPTIVPTVMWGKRRIDDAVNLPLDPNNPASQDKIWERMPATPTARQLLLDRKKKDAGN